MRLARCCIVLTLTLLLFSTPALAVTVWGDTEIHLYDDSPPAGAHTVWVYSESHTGGIACDYLTLATDIYFDSTYQDGYDNGISNTWLMTWNWYGAKSTGGTWEAYSYHNAYDYDPPSHDGRSSSAEETWSSFLADGALQARSSWALTYFYVTRKTERSALICDFGQLFSSDLPEGLDPAVASRLAWAWRSKATLTHGDWLPLVAIRDGGASASIYQVKATGECLCWSYAWDGRDWDQARLVTAIW